MTITEAQKKATANYRAKNKDRISQLNKKHFKTWWDKPENKEKQRVRSQISSKKKQLKREYGDEIENMIVSEDKQHILIAFKNENTLYKDAFDPLYPPNEDYDFDKIKIGELIPKDLEIIEL